MEPSDEEVLAYFPSPSQDDEDEEIAILHQNGLAQQKTSSQTRQGNKHEELRSPRATEDDDGDFEGLEPDEFTESWGPAKQDYYNADVIETEQDALEEEAEAMRLQQKHLKNMAEADYGFDEAEWSAQEPTGNRDELPKAGSTVTEVLPQFRISDDLGFPERLKLLKGRYPEFEPLSKDLLDLQEQHLRISEELLRSGGDSTIPDERSRHQDEHQNNASANVLQVQHQALSLYLAALSLYFAFLTSTAAEDSGIRLPLPATDLQNHEVMENLVQCRGLWVKVKDLEIPEGRADRVTGERRSPKVQEEHILNMNVPEAVDFTSTARAQKRPDDGHKKSHRTAKEAKARAEAIARHTEQMRRMEEDFATLEELTSTNTRPKPKKPSSRQAGASLDHDSDLGEENDLTATDLADKAKRRKSLRFYTSQIAQKANRRGAAGRDAGGDMDIPYRERLKDRQARLNAEAERRGKKKVDDATALGGESDEDDHKQARQVRGDDGDDEDYYDVVAARAKQRKQDKRDRAQAYSQATKEGGRVVETEGDIGVDGKRKITSAIERNRGLAPHRKKEVRNPRVKKRLKFDS